MIPPKDAALLTPAETAAEETAQVADRARFDDYNCQWAIKIRAGRRELEREGRAMTEAWENYISDTIATAIKRSGGKPRPPNVKIGSRTEESADALGVFLASLVELKSRSGFAFAQQIIKYMARHDPANAEELDAHGVHGALMKAVWEGYKRGRLLRSRKAAPNNDKLR